MKEFTFDLIHPNSDTVNSNESCGNKVLVIGKPGTGKSTLIKALAYAKQNYIPAAVVISGSERSNSFYKSFIPNSFIYEDYDEEVLKRLVIRQTKVVPKHIRIQKNKWLLVVVDDCSHDKNLFNSAVQNELFKNGRHYKILYVVGVQYLLDVPAKIRNNIDGVFIFREVNEDNLKRIYRNFGGIIPDFKQFKELIFQHTGEHKAIYIDNMRQNNDWRDCVYTVKVDLPPDQFEFGSQTFWQHHNERSKREDETS